MEKQLAASMEKLSSLFQAFPGFPSREKGRREKFQKDFG
jgi:hypothetical protein